MIWVRSMVGVEPDGILGIVSIASTYLIHVWVCVGMLIGVNAKNLAG